MSVVVFTISSIKMIAWLIENKWFIELILEHFYVKFGDPSCIVFGDIVRGQTEIKKTDSRRRWQN